MWVCAKNTVPKFDVWSSLIIIFLKNIVTHRSRTKPSNYQLRWVHIICSILYSSLFLALYPLCVHDHPIKQTSCSEHVRTTSQSWREPQRRGDNISEQPVLWIEITGKWMAEWGNGWYSWMFIPKHGNIIGFDPSSPRMSIVNLKVYFEIGYRIPMGFCMGFDAWTNFEPNPLRH